MEQNEVTVAVYKYRHENRGDRPSILIIHPDKASRLLSELIEKSIIDPFPITISRNHNIITIQGCELKIYRSYDIDPKKIIITK